MMKTRNLAEREIVLFDLDGTLTDSKMGIIKSAQYALAKCGITIADPEELLPFIGPPLRDSFRDLFGFNDEETDRAVAFYRERYGPIGIFENAVYPGISELLKELTKQHKRLFIATSKPEVFATRVAEHFQLQQYFEAVVGSNPDGTRTSKTEVIGCLIAIYGIERYRERIVMVGDRKYDLIGAHANGIAGIGVTYGYGTADELNSYQPEALAGSVAELADLLL